MHLFRLIGVLFTLTIHSSLELYTQHSEKIKEWQSFYQDNDCSLSSHAFRWLSKNPEKIIDGSDFMMTTIYFVNPTEEVDDSNISASEFLALMEPECTDPVRPGLFNRKVSLMPAMLLFWFEEDSLVYSFSSDDLFSSGMLKETSGFFKRCQKLKSKNVDFVFYPYGTSLAFLFGVSSEELWVAYENPEADTLEPNDEIELLTWDNFTEKYIHLAFAPFLRSSSE